MSPDPSSPDARPEAVEPAPTRGQPPAAGRATPAFTPPAGWDRLPSAFGPPPASGRIRSTPEDFEVIEDLGFEPSDDGDYVILRVRKREANTQWVARQIAQVADVPPKHINYAGQKDRYAVTEQSFSILLPGGGDPDWSRLAAEPGIEVLDARRNRRMIRRGGLAGNAFTIVLRELAGPDGSPVDRQAVEARLTALRERGLPNYFGPQRFGHGGGNLPRALAVFEGRLRERDRFKRGMYISAARSWLFNRVLAARVEAGSWDAVLEGDAMMLEGSRSFFKATEVDAEIRRRTAEMDIHPTGPLWGRGAPLVSGEALALETAALAGCEAWQRGLESVGTKQERRALRLPVRDLSWDWPDATALRLAFSLAPGAYATTVLAELVTLEASPADA
ncbi:MAG: tRNA pseudouridine(13) synthase TruD [Caldilineae bacterium]|nr:tRNA pseudouridine(13) synthase TruD [Caldilineae bacterium]